MQATALVAFLMAAFLSFPMVMRAHMSLAVVMATVVVFPVMMTVMVTFGIGIILQRSRRQGLCGRVGRTGNTAVEFYPILLLFPFVKLAQGFHLAPLCHREIPRSLCRNHNLVVLRRSGFPFV